VTIGRGGSSRSPGRRRAHRKPAEIAGDGPYPYANEISRYPNEISSYANTFSRHANNLSPSAPFTAPDASRFSP
jgi:hypothetical protein